MVPYAVFLITSTVFAAYHDEADSGAAVPYNSPEDQAQGTDFQRISATVKNDNDAGCCGTLWIFGISSTTFVKHFFSQVHAYNQDDASASAFVAGYFNSTSALDAFQFKFLKTSS